ncbi:hypothetical protein DY000_02040773 [Brassica cretica]|uniref:Uncharacterized protein n=1 Tax=Brassica cretica TaxID=69181 RepID=A0ABQ7BJ98_BRACR|nr:hypothetical protein DY000_02040773 [Brassica cretica]
MGTDTELNVYWKAKETDGNGYSRRLQGGYQNGSYGKTDKAVGRGRNRPRRLRTEGARERLWTDGFGVETVQPLI